MDIGSRGGAWTKKSPKLLLLEWTQSRKQPKPRFKTLPTDASTFRCKVCLADLSLKHFKVLMFAKMMFHHHKFRNCFQAIY